MVAMSDGRRPYPAVSVLVFAGLAAACGAALAQPRILDGELHHLRIDGAREWDTFPERPEADHLEIEFAARANRRPATLRLRQQDVKQTWQLRLNEQDIGRLRVDENDMVVYFPLPPGTLRDGANRLVIRQSVARRKTPDDIRVGEVMLDARGADEWLREARVTVRVVDADSGERIPGRITILNDAGALQTPGFDPHASLAVRPGIVYTSGGEVELGVPAGVYTLRAGRGFEYSLAETRIDVAPGDRESVVLEIRREVPTQGYIACDTHVHSRTHSGHGDATVQERMVTLAGEGIELPVATDHNVQIDHDPFARQAGVRSFFTPVIGNEVTTRTGHFNIFPVTAGAPIPNFRLDTWRETLRGIFDTPGVKVAVLNHARDLHGGTRPFGPRLFNAAVGENIAGWETRFNAMEVVNSGATQTDVMRLFLDWMALLNRGRAVTPIGSSDSHDVGRHFVGQGRTYIRGDDRDPSKIDVDQAVNNLLQGRVVVSYGLFAELLVNGKYGPGETVPVFDDSLELELRVLGPHWTEVDEVILFANGIPRQQWDVAEEAPAETGVLWSRSVSLAPPAHDVHLVLMALGPGIEGLHWKTAKPYQPDSPAWRPRVVSCSGAIWLDADGDGRRTPAHEYARRIVAGVEDDAVDRVLAALAPYDAAVAAQAAHVLQSGGRQLLEPSVQSALQRAAPAVQSGFRNYLDAWRATQQAR